MAGRLWREVLRLATATATLIAVLLIWSTLDGPIALASATMEEAEWGNETVIDAGALLESKLAEQPDLSMFVHALLVSRTFHVATSRAKNGGVTVLAPNNTAFSVFSPAVLECLYSQPASDNVLSQVAKYHILVGNHNASELIALRTVHADSGLALQFDVSHDRRVRISDGDGGDALMTRPDFRQLINATIHVIDTLMFPMVIQSAFVYECLSYAGTDSSAAASAPTPSSGAPPSIHL